MSENNPLSFGQRAKTATITFLRIFSRILVILISAALLGFLIYFGYVTVYKQAVLPARDNAERLSRLETSQAQEAPDLSALDQQVSALEVQLQAANLNLQAVKDDQTQLRAKLDQQNTELQRLDDLQTQLDSVRMQADQAFVIGAQAYQETVGKGARIDALERKVVLLKVASLLNRSRLYMVQSNFGLARDQVVMARTMLVELLGNATPEQTSVLNEWINRFDLALANLPGSPVPAADDLEIAWGLILQGLPETLIPTPTPYYPNPSYTPTPFLTSTPTPVGGLTIFPSHTPGPTIVP